MNKPWMPLYIGKYLSKTSHLNAAQSGAYLHLIMHYWQNGSLPADESALARIGRMTEPEWKKNRSVLAAFFYDGWKNKTAEEELAKAEQISNARRASAMQRHCKSYANAEPLQSKSTHTCGVIVSSLPLLPTSLESKEDSEEQACGQFAEFWKCYPNKIGRKDAKKAEKRSNPDPAKETQSLFTFRFYADLGFFCVGAVREIDADCEDQKARYDEGDDKGVEILENCRCEKSEDSHEKADNEKSGFNIDACKKDAKSEDDEVKKSC